MEPKNQADLDNHANQLNPNNKAYKSSRSENESDSKKNIEDSDWDPNDDDLEEEWIPQDAW